MDARISLRVVYIAAWRDINRGKISARLPTPIILPLLWSRLGDRLEKCVETYLYNGFNAHVYTNFFSANYASDRLKERRKGVHRVSFVTTSPIENSSSLVWVTIELVKVSPLATNKVFRGNFVLEYLGTGGKYFYSFPRVTERGH